MKAETRERLIIADAKEEASALLNILNRKLTKDERTEDLIRSTKDRAFQKKLPSEYELQ